MTSVKSPCKDCSDRAPGCAVSCKKWRDYAAERNKGYAARVWYSEFAGYAYNKISATKHRLYQSRKGKRK